MKFKKGYEPDHVQAAKDHPFVKNLLGSVMVERRAFFNTTGTTATHIFIPQVWKKGSFYLPEVLGMRVMNLRPEHGMQYHLARITRG